MVSLYPLLIDRQRYCMLLHRINCVSSLCEWNRSLCFRVYWTLYMAKIITLHWYLQINFFSSFCPASRTKEFCFALPMFRSIHAFTVLVFSSKWFAVRFFIYFSFLWVEKIGFDCKIAFTWFCHDFLMMKVKRFFTFGPNILSEFFDMGLDDGHELFPCDDFGMGLDRRNVTSRNKLIISSMHRWWLVFLIICVRLLRKMSASIEIATVIPPNTLNQFISFPYRFRISTTKSPMHFSTGWAILNFAASLLYTSTFLWRTRTRLNHQNITNKYAVRLVVWYGAKDTQRESP